jgi:hypothetical protein
VIIAQLDMQATDFAQLQLMVVVKFGLHHFADVEFVFDLGGAHDGVSFYLPCSITARWLPKSRILVSAAGFAVRDPLIDLLLCQRLKLWTVT